MGVRNCSPARSELLVPKPRFRENSEILLSRRRTLLFVDDDPDIVEVSAMAAESFGHGAITALNGRQGLDLYLRGGIDLVVSDLHMPEMSGLEMLREIKKANPDAKVIIASGGASDFEKEQLRQAGAAAIFGKPFDCAELEHIIEQVLGG